MPDDAASPPTHENGTTPADVNASLHNIASTGKDNDPPGPPSRPAMGNGSLRLLALLALVAGLPGGGFLVPWMIALICYGIVLYRSEDSRVLRVAKGLFGGAVVLWGVGAGYWNTAAYNTVTFETRERRVVLGVTVNEAVRASRTSKLLRLREINAFSDAEIDAGWVTDHASPWISDRWSGLVVLSHPYDRHVRPRLNSNVITEYYPDRKPVDPAVRVTVARLFGADLRARSDAHKEEIFLLLFEAGRDAPSATESHDVARRPCPE